MSRTGADGQPQILNYSVRAASLFVNNTGRDGASDLEIVFNWKPPYLNIWPQRDYTVGTNPDGRYIIKVANLGTKEFLGLDLLAVNAELPDVVQVRSSQGAGVQITMVPQPVYAKWKIICARFLVFMGLASVIYLLFAVIQFGLDRPTVIKLTSLGTPS
jgi:hypothetical protein